VIAIVSNAWDESEDESIDVFWKSRVELVFQYRVFKKTRLVCFRRAFHYIDNRKQWETIPDVMISIFFLILGFPTLGLFWSQKTRCAILSAGMEVEEKES
jgi:hypothetical protein